MPATFRFLEFFRFFWFFPLKLVYFWIISKKNIYGCFFYSFCATDLIFGTKNNEGMKYSTLKTVIFASYWGSPPGNDLLCKVHNPLKRLFGHEKNRQLADYRRRYRFFLRCLPRQNFDEFWNFMSACMYRDCCPKFATGLKCINRHRSKNIWVTQLRFLTPPILICQNFRDGFLG